MTTPLTSIPCVVCGKHVPGGKRIQAHCLTDECSRAYAYHAMEQRIEHQGDHKIWHGQIRRGVAWVSVVTGRGGGPNHDRQDFRVLDLQTGEFATYRRYRNLCGVTNCVTAEHNEVIRAKPRVRDRKDPMQNHLPAGPLVEKVRNGRFPMNDAARQYLQKCQKRGYITIKKGDEFCIDVLHIHPFEVWGEEFYTA